MTPALGDKYRVLCRNGPRYPGEFISQCTGHDIRVLSFKLLLNPVSQFSLPVFNLLHE